MTSYISLAEAASLLGVTKETLRNWDKSGKLKPVRNSTNNYRMYLLKDVQGLNPMVLEQQTMFESAISEDHGFTGEVISTDETEKRIRRLLVKLHRILRDTDANSSIIERFDEVTKLLFLKLLVDRSRYDSTLFDRKSNEQKNDYAEKIRLAFRSSTDLNGTLFPMKFRELRLSDAALDSLGSALNEISLATGARDVKGYAYEEMIRNTFDKGDHQQFFTPQSIVEFMVGLVEENLSGVIADPACGTGGFLVEVAKRKIENVNLIGLEIDERLAWVSGINLYVHNTPKFQTMCLGNGGTLGAAGRQFSEKFDVILTNPPFGSDFTERDELDTYILGRGKVSRRRGILFLERSLALLREGGWLVVVIDEGVLSLPSAADVRDVILGQAELCAVISLPEAAFMPYANVNTSILLLRKRTVPSTNYLTFYARAENVGRKANGDPDLTYDETGLPSLNNDLPSILAVWRQFERTGVLERQTVNLFVGKTSGNNLSLDRAENRLDFRFHHPARVAAEAAVARCEFPLVQLGDLCGVRNESCVPSIDLTDQIIPYTGLAHMESYVGLANQVRTPANSLSSAVKRYCRGDILFAKMRPGLRKVAYADWLTPGYTSAECIVLTVREKNHVAVIDPLLLSILLRSDFVFGQIIHLIAGIGRPRITLKDLLRVKVPVPPNNRQVEILNAFSAAKGLYERTRNEARQLEATATHLELQAINNVANAFVTKG
ncbi:N-6 DNA methylase [Actimicrobium sp. CCC2.4]|uniref:N-6 DNA methylase n=1 Tax=Actimicrobium sp. CCC2.4 TaxID=3048606 RepID=UPI002AC9183A|nr:N-6 DNA methylase [Actimicrobium sp. CCC2.4]MEB0134618.1 N-6 DNA methylase [Actimicrobium sp. CCC2.4]WPX30560.1 N-6 DNA methylase [Actimicrobium sp. CCC2.4]